MMVVVGHNVGEVDTHQRSIVTANSFAGIRNNAKIGRK